MAFGWIEGERGQGGQGGYYGSYKTSSILKFSSLLLSRWGGGQGGEEGQRGVEKLASFASYLSSYLPSSPTTVVSKISSSLCMTLCGCKALLALASLALLHLVLNHLSVGRIAHNVVNLLSVAWVVVGLVGVEEWLREIQVVAVRVWLVNLFLSSAVLLYRRDVCEKVPTLHLSLLNRSVPVLSVFVGALVGLVSAEVVGVVSDAATSKTSIT
jgi:hypothetical protein